MDTKNEDIKKIPSLLIIDDDIDIANMLSIYLTGFGYKVLIAYRGADGVKMAVSTKPDLVLLDISLPDIDGFEVMQEFIKRKVRTRVIVLTHFAYIDWMVRLIRAGACDCLAKPFDIEELKLRINRALKLENTMNFYRLETLTWEVKTLMSEAEKQYGELQSLQYKNEKLEEKLKFAGLLNFGIRVSYLVLSALITWLFFYLKIITNTSFLFIFPAILFFLLLLPIERIQKISAKYLSTETNIDIDNKAK